MPSLYHKGQKVTIVPSKGQPLSPRGSNIEPYIGKSGTITDYYWVNLHTNSLYVYTIHMDKGKKDIVVHEDELKAYIE